MGRATGSEDYLAALNPAQRAAATWGGSVEHRAFEATPLLVIAGAGTGKTMALAHRVAHLIVEGVSAERILLLTFTRRAAKEMTRRAEAIVRQALKRAGAQTAGAQTAGAQTAGAQGHGFSTLPWSGTFHSIANRLIRRYALNLGLDPAFSVLDRGDSADLMDVLRHELDLSQRARRFPKKDTCLAIYSHCVNTRRELADCLQHTFPWCTDWEPELRRLFRRYVERKQESQSLDYDDLLLYWGHLVADRGFADEIGAWFDHVLVDEYQDTNLLQAEILRAMKPDGSGLTVVGDDAQSIYSFRAARVENMLDFPAQYVPQAHIIRLERNYRSTQSILDTANRLIAESEKQFPKHLESARAQGAKPQYVTVEDGDAEAEYVVGAILENREQGMQLRDQAVLFRGAHHSDRLELELVRRNIPYVKYGGLRFLEAGHVKDLMSILKWAENARNDVAGFRVLKLLPGMGPKSAARCFCHLGRAGFRFSSLASYRPPVAAREYWPSFRTLMESLSAAEPDDESWQRQLGEARRWYQPHLERLYDGLLTRESDLEQLEQISGRYPTRERFLTELTLDPPAASGDLAGDPLLDEDYLILSTVHSAKGQEWDAVFVLNVSDGNFPSEFSTGDPAMIEEERRVLYVAMTRARQDLRLIAPFRYHVTKQPGSGDRHVYAARSRFITHGLLQTMDQRHYGRGEASCRRLAPQSDRRINVQNRLKEMW